MPRVMAILPYIPPLAPAAIIRAMGAVSQRCLKVHSALSGAGCSRPFFWCLRQRRVMSSVASCLSAVKSDHPSSC